MVCGGRQACTVFLVGVLVPLALGGTVALLLEGGTGGLGGTAYRSPSAEEPWSEAGMGKEGNRSIASALEKES